MGNSTRTLPACPQLTFIIGLTTICTAALLTLPILVYTVVGICCLLLCFYNIPLWQYKKELLTINVFFIFLLVTMPLTFSVYPQPQHNPALIHLASFVAINTQHLALAWLLILKGNCIFILYLCFIRPLPLALLCSILIQFGVSTKLVTLLLLVARHIATIKQEAVALHTAAKLRGFTLQTSIQSYKTSAYLIGMLFIRCYDTGKRIEDAMRLRGFAGTFPLLLPHLPPATPQGYCLTTVVIIACICALTYNFGIL